MNIDDNNVVKSNDNNNDDYNNNDNNNNNNMYLKHSARPRCFDIVKNLLQIINL